MISPTFAALTREAKAKAKIAKGESNNELTPAPLGKILAKNSGRNVARLKLALKSSFAYFL